MKSIIIPQNFHRFFTASPSYATPSAKSSLDSESAWKVELVKWSPFGPEPDFSARGYSCWVHPIALTKIFLRFLAYFSRTRTDMRGSSDCSSGNSLQLSRTDHGVIPDSIGRYRRFTEKSSEKNFDRLSAHVFWKSREIVVFRKKLKWYRLFSENRVFLLFLKIGI